MDLTKYYLLLVCAVYGVYSRPHQMSSWGKEQFEAVDSSGILATPQSLDITSLSFIDSFSRAAPSLAPVLTFGVVSYIAYVASALYVPGVLTSLGIPVLDDFSPSRLKRSPTNESKPNFLTNLAGDFVMDVLSKTEAAETVKSTGRTVLSKSANVVRKITQRADDQLGFVQGLVNTTITALSPGCLSNFMCKAGQFTSLHFPAIGALLRGIDSRKFDDHALALIDGTTLGDCNSVFHKCQL